MGRPRSQHLPLHPAFKQAIRTSGVTLRALCLSAGFPAEDEPSTWRNGLPVRTTPLVVGRLGAIARAILYTGPVFLRPDEPGEGPVR